MWINFRNILYNYCRNTFRRVLRNASETGSAITRWAVRQHAPHSVVDRHRGQHLDHVRKGEHPVLFAQTRPLGAPPRRPADVMWCDFKFELDFNIKLLKIFYDFFLGKNLRKCGPDIRHEKTQPISLSILYTLTPAGTRVLPINLTIAKFDNI
jgi:hypothetical protein